MSDVPPSTAANTDGDDDHETPPSSFSSPTRSTARRRGRLSDTEKEVRDAEKSAKKAEKEAEKAAKKAAREAEKAQKHAQKSLEKEIKKETKKAEQEAKREAKKEAKRLAREAEDAAIEAQIEEGDLVPRRILTHQLDPPAPILLPLLAYQREWLHWAVEQEKGPIRGGILADEMGMGKTIQALSLMCAHRREGDHPGVGESEETRAMRNVQEQIEAKRIEEEGLAAQKAAEAAAAGIKGKAAKGPKMTTWEVAHPAVVEGGCEVGNACGTTLVVCPVIAVVQWIQEIDRGIANGSVKMVVFHGPKRHTITRETLESADLVITTYSVVEQEYRKHCMPKKVKCPYCDRGFYPKKLKFHVKFFCGPGAQRTEAQMRTMKKDGEEGRRGLSMGTYMKRKFAALKEEKEKDERKGKIFPITGKKRVHKAPVVKKVKMKEEEEEEEPDVDMVDREMGMETGRKTRGRRVSYADFDERAEEEDDSDYRDASVGIEEEEDEEEDEEVKTASSFKAAAETKQTSVSRGGQGSPSRGTRNEEVIIVSDDEGAYEEEYDSEDDRYEDDPEQKAAEALIGQIVAHAEAQERSSSFSSLLHSIHWRRIILDEAHCIKDKRTNTAQGVFLLSALYRWALSGTPLQNRVNELYSQIRFLRINPFSYFYCTKCPCRCLDYPFKEDFARCSHCGHGPLQHFNWWNRVVANPIIYNGYEGRGRVAMHRLKHEVLDKTMLRRTKNECADVLALPPRQMYIRRLTLDVQERDFYEALYTQSQASFGAFVETGTLVNNYAHIFDLLIRLRQAVCHPYLVIHSPSKNLAPPLADLSDVSHPGVPTAAAPSPKGYAEDLCSICHEAFEDPLAAECGHVYCRVCVLEYIESIDATARCPKIGCDRPLTLDFDQTAPSTIGMDPNLESSSQSVASAAPKRATRGILSRIDKNNFRTSSKLEALREEIDKMLESDPTAKCLVFSQFTSLLDLIEHRLVHTGVRVLRLTGGMTLPQRDAVIGAFMRDPTATVLLMSLKAGGVALNLTVASHVMLMDLWWNPAVEQQAFDRVHRLGQHKPVKVIRFVIAGTIEERILKLQDKKRLVFEGTVGQDTEALNRLTTDDLKFLFH
jgi:SNF2 family DNA or RNA helicase